jgi:hypothetical protein
MKRPPITKKLRFQILERDCFTCQYCGRRAPDVALEVDHRIPVASGGNNDPSNLVTACWDCNSGKRARDIPSPIALAAQVALNLDNMLYEIIGKRRPVFDSGYDDLNLLDLQKILLAGKYDGLDAAIEQLNRDVGRGTAIISAIVNSGLPIQKCMELALGSLVVGRESRDPELVEMYYRYKESNAKNSNN